MLLAQNHDALRQVSRTACTIGWVTTSNRFGGVSISKQVMAACFDIRKLNRHKGDWNCEHRCPRFRSGVPNLRFIKCTNILIIDMNFLQAAQYDIPSIVESRLIMLVLNAGSSAADDAVLLRYDKFDTSNLCLVKQATVKASYPRRQESSSSC